jgi:hypothetical protein
VNEIQDRERRTTLVYLAGPIDGIDRKDALGWREKLAEEAPSMVLLFNPVTAYHGVNAGTAIAADQVNRMVIARCSAVIANLSGPGRAFGTIREIEFARFCEKLVVIVNDRPEDSLLAYDCQQVRTPEDALIRVLEEYVFDA